MSKRILEQSGGRNKFPGLNPKLDDNRLLDAIMARTRKTIRQSTVTSRNALDNMKALIISNNKVINGITGSNLIDKLEEGSNENVIDIINKGVFYALDPNANGISARARYKQFNAALKEATGYVGIRQNTEYDYFVKKVLGKSELADLFNNDEETEQFIIIKPDTPISSEEAKRNAIEQTNQAFDSWDGESSLFGIDVATLRSQAVASDRETVGNSAGRRTVIYVYKYEEGLYHQYTQVKVNINVRIGPTLAPEDVAVKKSPDRVATHYHKIWNASLGLDNVVVTPVNQRVDPKPILDLEREIVKEGVTIFDYGHLVSAGAKQLSDVLSSLASQRKNFDTTGAAIQRLDNMIATLTAIKNVATKLDGLLEDFDTVQGINQADLIQVLLNTDLDVDYLYYLEKTDGVVVTTKGPSRTQTIEVDGKIIVTELLAKKERRGFNIAKGRITSLLKNMAIKAIDDAWETALTEKDIMEKLAVSGSMRSGSDSFIEAVAKFALGLKIDKGTGKTRRKKIGTSISIFAGSRVPLRNKRVSKYNKPKKAAKKSVGATSRGVGGTSGGGANVVSLVSMINTEITNEVMRRMNSPGLQNRTGRFARSVQATRYDAATNSMFYRYMYSPYEVFSSSRGKSPWNSIPARDPAALINAAMRSIVSKQNSVLSSTMKFMEE